VIRVYHGRAGCRQRVFPRNGKTNRIGGDEWERKRSNSGFRLAVWGMSVKDGRSKRLTRGARTNQSEYWFGAGYICPELPSVLAEWCGMRVELSGHRFIFPNNCACCGKPPDTTITVSATNPASKTTPTKTWDIPYCSGCVSHVRSAELAERFNAAGCLAVVAVFGLGAAVAWWLGVVAGVACLIAVSLHDKQTCDAHRLAAEKARCTSCTGLKQAVDYVSWRATCHCFEVTSTTARVS